MISQVCELTAHPPRKNVPKKNEAQLSIVIADDHPVIGTLLSKFLATAGGYRLAGVATDGETALELCRTHRPDLMILDLVMPRLGGLEVLGALQAEGLPTRALVFTSLQTPEALHEAMIKGAYAFLAKTTPFDEVMGCLEKVSQGQFAFTGEASSLLRQWVVSGDQGAALNSVETAVLRHVALGHPAKEISTEIHLSESGTYRLIERVKHKLKAETLQELTLVAVRRGLVPL